VTSPYQRARASLWSVLTMNAVVWSAAITCLVEGFTPPWWAMPLVLIAAMGAAIGVGVFMTRD